LLLPVGLGALDWPAMTLAARLFLPALSFAVACGGAPTQPPESPPLELLGTPSDAPAGPVAAGDDVAAGTRALEANDAKGAKAAFDRALVKNPNNADAL
jgi:hypothetical protein